MTWAQRLKRIFGIDIETCPAYGGVPPIIVCIENPKGVRKMLTHIDSETLPLNPPGYPLSGATAGAWVLIDPTSRPVPPPPTLTG